MVNIVAYNPAWPEHFNQARDRLLAATGDLLQQVEHIGSTSVPGLAAKAIIDIMAGVEAIDAFDASDGKDRILSLGYDYKPDYEDAMPFRRYFRLIGDNPNEPRGHLIHLHLVPCGCPFWVDQLLFRDYLRTHPAERDAYAALKLDLAAQCMDNPTYTDAKTDFVQGILQQARL